ncbi:MAG: glucose-1-phosphate adenylyltransferase [Ardenticatenales bacterium]|nr:glucose-1-phosphate adenylyltransferase [Ardenticatenales bacterium]
MRISNEVLGLILGGGRGTRLSPLTRERSKPAVPLAGRYRLIDIPMSNCFNAGIDKIAILTQFNSVSLHRHIYNTYVRDVFSKGWVQIWAAEQTPTSADWYQGTADAVRKQIIEIRSADVKYILVLAGDHLYRMDYAEFLQYHVDKGADISVAVQPVPHKDASQLGILKLNPDGQISTFREKPKTAAELAGMESGSNPDKPYMASMGIYVFNLDVLLALLENEGADDFGHDIIPGALSTHRVMGFQFDGYWADIGTIRRFYEVNLQLTQPNAAFNFYDADRPIYTRPRFLPGTTMQGREMENVLLGDGSLIAHASLHNSVIGLRSVIGDNVVIRESVLMGADYYESDADRAENRRLGRPDIGIGDDTVIEGAIIDKNARIGKGVRIRIDTTRPDSESENWVARDGLVIIPKNAILPDGMVI